MDENLLLGVQHIDYQHHEIFRSFQGLLSSGTGDESISEALSRLTNLIHNHFRSEEAFMDNLGMPAEEILAHSRAHSEIIESLTSIHLDAMMGLRVPFEEIINRVSAYTSQHVIEFDLGLKAYISQPD